MCKCMLRNKKPYKIREKNVLQNGSSGITYIIEERF